MVSVWVPCCGVSMGLPELEDCIDLSCNSPSTQACSPSSVGGAGRKVQPALGLDQKPVTGQNRWAQEETEESPIQRPAQLGVWPSQLCSVLCHFQSVQFLMPRPESGHGPGIWAPKAGLHSLRCSFQVSLRFLHWHLGEQWTYPQAARNRETWSHYNPIETAVL